MGNTYSYSWNFYLHKPDDELSELRQSSSQLVSEAVSRSYDFAVGWPPGPEDEATKGTRNDV